jgi:arylsulfatase A-like enzyme
MHSNVWPSLAGGLVTGKFAMPFIGSSQLSALRCLVCLVLTVVGILSPACAQEAASHPAPRPNIVFILLDDAGFSDFGAYGSEVATPNIDRIALSGARLTNFHTASSCEASRAMLMSGVDNHRAGAGSLKVVLADNQRGQPGYEGYLSDKAHSLGRLLKEGGYATYFAGKWNLGDGIARSPGARGWDRYIALEQTGADNFEDGKIYAPLNLAALRWEDGKRAVLPANFFSSDHYADRLIQYIGDGRRNNKPFFAMLALQAVHSPLQAPDADIAKYRQHYQAGWTQVRAQRYRRQVAMGLLPDGLPLSRGPGARDWEKLSESERQAYAKKMAVFAAMMDNADQNVGRLRAYLQQIGQLENTAFVIMSDNGADPYELNRLNLPFKLWYQLRFKLDPETLGQKGSYAHYGQDWAEVSNTPFALFKGTAGEGGMRVPFMLSYPQRIKAGQIDRNFAYATDFLPTMLDLAGIPMPAQNGQEQHLYAPTGSSLLPHLEGKLPAFHSASEAIGFEATGAEALFKGSYKLVRNPAPFGDGKTRLIDLAADPLETLDLSRAKPEVLRAMQGEMEQYVSRNGVIRPPPGFNGPRQVLINNWPILLRQLLPILSAAALVLLLLLVGLARLLRARRRTRQLKAA